MRSVRTFLALPGEVKRLLPEAAALSWHYRRLVMDRPFSQVAATLGQQGYETPADEDYTDRIMPVRQAVELVCRHTPWESKCLVRALTARKMLNRRGCPCTLYMGVQPGADGKMEAHAWLRCGGRYVTGGRGEGFAVTGIFGDIGKETKEEGRD